MPPQDFHLPQSVPTLTTSSSSLGGPKSQHPSSTSISGGMEEVASPLLFLKWAEKAASVPAIPLSPPKRGWRDEVVENELRKPKDTKKPPVALSENPSTPPQRKPRWQDNKSKEDLCESKKTQTMEQAPVGLPAVPSLSPSQRQQSWRDDELRELKEAQPTRRASQKWQAMEAQAANSSPCPTTNTKRPRQLKRVPSRVKVATHTEPCTENDRRAQALLTMFRTRRCCRRASRSGSGLDRSSSNISLSSLGSPLHKDRKELEELRESHMRGSVTDVLHQLKNFTYTSSDGPAVQACQLIQCHVRTFLTRKRFHSLQRSIRLLKLKTARVERAITVLQRFGRSKFGLSAFVPTVEEEPTDDKDILTGDAGPGEIDETSPGFPKDLFSSSKDTTRSFDLFGEEYKQPQEEEEADAGPAELECKIDIFGTFHFGGKTTPLMPLETGKGDASLHEKNTSLADTSTPTPTQGFLRTRFDAAASTFSDEKVDEEESLYLKSCFSMDDAVTYEWCSDEDDNDDDEGERKEREYMDNFTVMATKYTDLQTEGPVYQGASSSASASGVSKVKRRLKKKRTKSRTRSWSRGLGLDFIAEASSEAAADVTKTLAQLLYGAKPSSADTVREKMEAAKKEQAAESMLWSNMAKAHPPPRV
eukprot:CAMPEP_0116857382 /NCGR_PEP_ID=MMETSP0418-20121206/20513_1 /TAXON_ID=1158023 /ORGANISM="Astrosyne radiata, Strain 13vi08-1A" /LENGTH=646 /DNA_ID=CAMNT_0004491041 /DNA_START=33 /DNA_END=1973 /DNA_ORIENTATION=-